MAMSAEHIKVKMFSPSPAMVTSPNEWKIFEWDIKNFKQADKKNIFCSIVFVVIFFVVIFIFKIIDYQWI